MSVTCTSYAIGLCIKILHEYVATYLCIPCCLAVLNIIQNFIVSLMYVFLELIYGHSFL